MMKLEVGAVMGKTLRCIDGPATESKMQARQASWHTAAFRPVIVAARNKGVVGMHVGCWVGPKG